MNHSLNLPKFIFHEQFISWKMNNVSKEYNSYETQLLQKLIENYRDHFEQDSWQNSFRWKETHHVTFPLE